MKRYRAISRCLAAIENCEKSGNAEWKLKHGERLKELVDGLPSGSGIDTGTKIGDKSTSEKLRFYFSFHHMNEDGFYDGWSDHSIFVSPSLAWGFKIRVTGRNYNQIKDYLAETYHFALNEEIDEYTGKVIEAKNQWEGKAQK